MSDVKHRIFFGFNSTIDVDGDPDAVETFNILLQSGDVLLTEASNNLIKENG